MHKRIVFTLPVLLLAAVLLSVSSSHTAPVSFNTALPVAKGEFILREQAVILRSTDNSGGADRDLSVLAIPSVLVYGVNEKLALFGIVPYVNKSLDITTPAGRVNRDTSGLGDVTALARYTMWSRDRLGSTMRLAPFVGLEMPTGDNAERDSLGRIPQPLQGGSGSWDPRVGTIFTWQTFDWEFDSSVGYQFNTKANSFQFGDRARVDLSYQYRLWPRELSGGVPAFFYGVLESNLLFDRKNEIGGMNDPNSGGMTWFLAPGLQYVTKRVILEGVVQIPVRQDLNGSALRNDYVIRAGFRVSF